MSVMFPCQIYLYPLCMRCCCCNRINCHLTEFSHQRSERLTRDQWVRFESDWINGRDDRLKIDENQLNINKRQIFPELVYQTRPGVQQCQAQGLVFCPGLGSIQDKTRMFKINKSELIIFSLNIEHIELPHVLDLAVHLSNWMGRVGVILRPLGTLLLPLLKVVGGW